MYPRVTKPFAGCTALRRHPRDLHAGIHVTSVHPELGSNSQNLPGQIAFRLIFAFGKNYLTGLSYPYSGKL